MIKVEDGKIYIVRGDDEALAVELTVGDPPETYEMRDGDELTLTVREMPDAASAPLIQVRSAPGVNRIILRHEDTAELDYGAYSADIQLRTAEGFRKTVWPSLETEDGTRLRIKNLKNFCIASEVTLL